MANIWPGNRDVTRNSTEEISRFFVFCILFILFRFREKFEKGLINPITQSQYDVNLMNR